MSSKKSYEELVRDSELEVAENNKKGVPSSFSEWKKEMANDFSRSELNKWALEMQRAPAMVIRHAMEGAKTAKKGISKFLGLEDNPVLEKSEHTEVFEKPIDPERARNLSGTELMEVAEDIEETGRIRTERTPEQQKFRDSHKGSKFLDMLQNIFK
jgi:hypothetical protein